MVKIKCKYYLVSTNTYTVYNLVFKWFQSQFIYCSTPKVYLNSDFGESSGPVWMDRLGCSGTEADIALCSFSGWGNTRCSHKLDAGVSCSGMLWTFPFDILRVLFYNLAAFDWLVKRYISYFVYEFEKLALLKSRVTIVN